MPAAAPPTYAASLKANNLYKNSSCVGAVNTEAASAYKMGRALGYAEQYNKNETAAFNKQVISTLKGFGKI